MRSKTLSAVWRHEFDRARPRADRTLSIAPSNYPFRAAPRGPRIATKNSCKKLSLLRSFIGWHLRVGTRPTSQHPPTVKEESVKSARLSWVRLFGVRRTGITYFRTTLQAAGRCPNKYFCRWDQHLGTSIVRTGTWIEVPGDLAQISAGVAAWGVDPSSSNLDCSRHTKVHRISR